ncbi:MAG: hypothetical protein AAB443_00210 [Patescibacteria group bacterium]
MRGLIDKILTIELSLDASVPERFFRPLEKHLFLLVCIVLSLISISSFYYFHENNLTLAYNDARSHLNIGRRVVEGLKPGIAQLGSVWLPLPHVLMIPTIWNDFMWHTGLAGASVNMIAFVITGMFIFLYLKELKVGTLGKVSAVLVFILNINILYLQSTAMTELLLILTMTASCYEMMQYFKKDDILHLIRGAFWIMLTTLTRYDGWFLLAVSSFLIALKTLRKRDYKTTEGTLLLFCTLAGLGVVMWFAWNLLIFKDPFYFAFGPFSAKAQQDQIESSGMLITKGDWFQSFKFYLYALMFNSGAFQTLLTFFGFFILWKDKKVIADIKMSSVLLLSPLIFNILALYLGHSVLFIQGLSGNTWFNVRYGVLLAPTIAIIIGFTIDRLKAVRLPLIGLLTLVTFFSFTSFDAVTIDDARVGSSQKNVAEVSGWLSEHAKNEKGFILISAASHDAIIFSSGLPMKRFIHEGTGLYWESATSLPDRWARWIIMRTHDDNDLTFKLVKLTPGLERYNKVGSFPFADIYEIKPEYVSQLNTEPILGKQK